MVAMKSVVKVTISGRDFEFVCQPDSPLPDALEAHNQFGAFLLGKQEQNKTAQTSQETSVVPTENVETTDIRTEN